MIAENQMTDEMDDVPAAGYDDEQDYPVEDDFAALLDEYDYDMPHRGQILEGIVLEASSDEILLDVGQKRDAIVTRKDLSLLDDKLRESIVPGKLVMTYVLQPRNYDGDLIVSINKALELEDWAEAHELQESGQIVEAEVVNTNRGGILVKYGRLTGFVPQSHLISLPRFTSADELITAKKRMIGEMLPLKFIEIDRKRNRLILSERDARQEAQQSRLSELTEGQQVTGRVVSIVDFGVFVDIGGVDGLIHISKLDHHHVNHPGEVVAVGDEVEVLIDSIDAGASRISLNRVALLPDPWEAVMKDYNVGDLIQGSVTNVVDFGIFVQIPNGLQGLVHVSRMSSFGTSNPRDLVREGDVVLVRIVSIEPDRQRIGLSMDDVTIEEQEEWMHKRREEDEAAGEASDTAPAYAASAAIASEGADETAEVEADETAEDDTIAEAEDATDVSADDDDTEAEAETEDDLPVTNGA